MNKINLLSHLNATERLRRHIYRYSCMLSTAAGSVEKAAF